ncbi:MAG: TolC family protein [Syntrophales bacterium]|nr:TolC family protein [Syntrophales bacterium]
MHGPIILAILYVLILPGCVLLQPTEPFGPVPTTKATGIAVPAPSQPVPAKEEAIPETLTLERSLEIALKNNPEVAATLWDVSAAGAKLDQAKAARLPTLTYEGNYIKYLNSRPLWEARFNNQRRIFTKQQSRGDVLLKLPLFTGGRIINEIKAADLFRLAEQDRLSRTKDELVFNVSSTFYAILSQEKVIDSVKFSLQAMREQRQKMAKMVEVEKAAKVDLLRTEVRLADLEQSLEKETNVLEVQKRLLANLMGLDFDKARMKFAGKLTFKKVGYRPEQLVSKALELRPDFKAAKERLASQARRVNVARAGHYPNVNLVGAYGYRGSGLAGVNDDRNPLNPTDRGPFYDDDGQIGVTVTLPLFEGGRISAKVREEISALAAAQERLRKLNLQVRQEVETAILDVNSSSERVKATEKAIEQGRESLRIETLKYNLGAGTVTDVLDAQTALLVTETNYYRALADFRTALARLKLAVGGNLS